MKRILNTVRSHWVVLTALMLSVITVLSLWPLETLPEAPGSDKLHHFIAYGFLALPAALRKPRYWIGLCILFIAYSGLIELVQPYVNRYGEWKDMLANSSGIVCGVITAGILQYLLRENNNSGRKTVPERYQAPPHDSTTAKE